MLIIFVSQSICGSAEQDQYAQWLGGYHSRVLGEGVPQEVSLVCVALRATKPLNPDKSAISMSGTCQPPYLTYLGAAAGSPNEIDMHPPAGLSGAALAEWNAGKLVVAQSGCLACHKIGENGNAGPGPDLTEIGSKLAPTAIAQTLRNPTDPMPPFQKLAQEQPEKFAALVSFLGQLK